MWQRPATTASGAPCATPTRTRADPALVKALARAHRWKRLLESGRYGSLAELASAERIDRSFLAKTLRLTLLAPDIVEAILDGRQPCALALPALLQSVPSLWDEQRSSITEIGGRASGLPPGSNGARGNAPAWHPVEPADAGTECEALFSGCHRA